MLPFSSVCSGLAIKLERRSPEGKYVEGVFHEIWKQKRELVENDIREYREVGKRGINKNKLCFKMSK